MRFARRCEGILSARLVFKLAREDPRVGYQVFVSAALMEYFCSKVGIFLLSVDIPPFTTTCTSCIQPHPPTDGGLLRAPE